MLVAPQIRSECQQKHGAKKVRPPMARRSRPNWPDPTDVQEALPAADRPRGGWDARPAGRRRLRPREQFDSCWRTNRAATADLIPGWSRPARQFLGELAQRRLATVFARLDQPAWQAHLSGVIRHVGACQDERQMPLPVTADRAGPKRPLAGRAAGAGPKWRPKLSSGW